jgi:monoterpene epsilon-lactone hydrolase
MPCYRAGCRARAVTPCYVERDDTLSRVGILRSGGTLMRSSSAILLLASAALLGAQQPTPTTASAAPTSDTSYIDENGAAHITRVVPVPENISPEAQKVLSRRVPDTAHPDEPLAQRRARMVENAAHARDAWRKICAVNIADSEIAGVPVHLVTPADPSTAETNKVAINLHGGGFNVDSGSLAESIPIAVYARIKVVSVLYRLAPEHPFPAAVDDTVAVYKDLLKKYTPNHIAIFGTSAGAMLTAEVAVKLKQLGLPLPAALGIFSGMGDFARHTDSEAIFAGGGLSGHLDLPKPGPDRPDYVGSTDPRDPALSPIYADLSGLPPTLLLAGGRDYLLSGAANLHRAFMHAGVDARLVVFDGLPHAFWYDPSLPESIEATHLMADFLRKKLGS